MTPTNGLFDGLQKTKLNDLKKARVRLEQEVQSIRDRVADIQWRIDGSEFNYPVDTLLHERQRAIDKMRETQKELLLVREELIDMGVE